MVDRDLIAQLKLGVEQTLGEFQTPGTTMAVHINGQSFVETGVGYRDIKQEVLLATNAKFYIYSITKSLLAIAVLHLVHEGQLDLNIPVQSYLPNLSLVTPITLRHLLTHTSGLADYGGLRTYVDAVKSAPSFPWSVETFLNLIHIQDLKFMPGEGWAYSNIGYLLVKCVLEQVTNLSLPDCLQEIIFKPLALQNTFVPLSLSDVRELTPGYSTFFSADELQDVTSFYHPSWVAHGVVVSTAPELAQIIDALFAGKLLDSLLVEQMLRPAYILGKHPPFEHLGYGLGFFCGCSLALWNSGGTYWRGARILYCCLSLFQFSWMSRHSRRDR